MSILSGKTQPRHTQPHNKKNIYIYIYILGLFDILNAIVMRILSVKTVLSLAVNLHQLFSNGIDSSGI